MVAALNGSPFAAPVPRPVVGKGKAGKGKGKGKSKGKGKTGGKGKGKLAPLDDEGEPAREKDEAAKASPAPTTPVRKKKAAATPTKVRPPVSTEELKRRQEEERKAIRAEVERAKMARLNMDVSIRKEHQRKMEEQSKSSPFGSTPPRRSKGKGKGKTPAKGKSSGELPRVASASPKPAASAKPTESPAASMASPVRAVPSWAHGKNPHTPMSPLDREADLERRRKEEDERRAKLAKEKNEAIAARRAAVANMDAGELEKRQRLAQQRIREYKQKSADDDELAAEADGDGGAAAAGSRPATSESPLKQAIAGREKPRKLPVAAPLFDLSDDDLTDEEDEYEYESEEDDEDGGERAGGSDAGSVKRTRSVARTASRSATESAMSLPRPFGGKPSSSSPLAAGAGDDGDAASDYSAYESEEEMFDEQADPRKALSTANDLIRAQLAGGAATAGASKKRAASLFRRQMRAVTFLIGKVEARKQRLRDLKKSTTAQHAEVSQALMLARKKRSEADGDEELAAQLDEAIGQMEAHLETLSEFRAKNESQVREAERKAADLAAKKASADT